MAAARSGTPRHSTATARQASSTGRATAQVSGMCPGSLNNAAIAAIGTAAATASHATGRRTSAQASATSPRNNPATGLVSVVSAARSSAGTHRRRRACLVAPDRSGGTAKREQIATSSPSANAVRPLTALAASAKAPQTLARTGRRTLQRSSSIASSGAATTAARIPVSRTPTTASTYGAVTLYAAG